MNLLKQSIPGDANVFMAGDRHIGNPASYRKGFYKMRDMIMATYDGLASQCNFYIDMGDIIEAITLDDNRLDKEHLENYSPIVQIQMAVEDYKPMADKIICMLDGNHPAKLWRVVPDLTKHACQQIGCPYGDYSAKVSFHDMHGNLAFKLYATHGRRSINSNLPDPAQAWASKQRSLKNALRELAGDCAVMAMGHTHQLVHIEPFKRLSITDDGVGINQEYIEQVPNASWIHPDLRFYINTGSFFRTQMVGTSTYAEKAQYTPLELGFYVLKVRDYKPVGLDRITL